MKEEITFLLVLAVVLVASAASGQVVDSGDLTSRIDTVIADMPSLHDGGDYLPPDQASRIVWREIIAHILAGEYGDAHIKALTASYQVVLFTDTESEDETVHVLLERMPGSASPYWGTIVFNTSPSRSHLVVQCPHPRYDLNTGFQGIRVYQTAGARAYFVSGTHRCNGLEHSLCDGTTTVCGSPSAPYRCSDQAHVVDSTFQITTATMLADDSDLLVIQPHGFNQGEDDPDLIISNGTRHAPTGIDYALRIRQALQVIDPSLGAKVGHVDLSLTRLLGTTNAQGRLINASPDPCETPAIAASGRFVHIEQARIGLRDTEQNWMKLAHAIAAAVPADVRVRRASRRIRPGGTP